jgi:Transposase
VSAALEAVGPELKVIDGKRSRRSWSDEEKQRIVLEAAVPGASVADLARGHGVNANLVFNWRKMALAASAAVTEVSRGRRPVRGVMHRRLLLPNPATSFRLEFLVGRRMVNLR